MIASLTGTVAVKDASQLVLEVNGVGYQLEMTSIALASLPPVGEAAHVYTYLQVRDDALVLFGFATLEEKNMFCKLITVSGVGPKLVLSALAALSPAAIAQAVALEDVKTLSSVPGLGKKTAQRLILELKGAFPAGENLFGTAAATASPEAPVATDTAAVQALLSMGFSSAEVQRALDGCDVAPEDTQAVIRYALRRLG